MKALVFLIFYLISSNIVTCIPDKFGFKLPTSSLNGLDSLPSDDYLERLMQNTLSIMDKLDQQQYLIYNFLAQNSTVQNTHSDLRKLDIDQKINVGSPCSRGNGSCAADIFDNVETTTEAQFTTIIPEPNYLEDIFKRLQTLELRQENQTNEVKVILNKISNIEGQQLSLQNDVAHQNQDIKFLMSFQKEESQIIFNMIEELKENMNNSNEVLRNEISDIKLEINKSLNNDLHSIDHQIADQHNKTATTVANFQQQIQSLATAQIMLDQQLRNLTYFNKEGFGGILEVQKHYKQSFTTMKDSVKQSFNDVITSLADLSLKQMNIVKTQELMAFYFSCPSNSYKEGLFCYVFESSRKSWANARDYCTSVGGDLVTGASDIKSIHEINKVIKKVTKQRLDFVHMLWWIGVRERQDSSWQWLDGSTFTSISGVWKVGSPAPGRGRGCGYIDSHTSKLNDADCRSELPFICEIRKS